jgi:NAD(P)-dependent dehydrogenase (short-subunit alcohol dehydrogenase family)
MPSALVTGASHGVGRAVAVYLSRRGFRVLCVARAPETLNATVKRILSEGGQAEALMVDLSKTTEVERLAKQAQNKFADLKVMAHLATPRPDPDAEATLESTPIEQIEGYVDVTVRATILLTKALQGLLAKNAPSHLFFMSSDWALRGAHGPAVFSAAKAAVAHFGRSIRREMARNGIRTTILLPGDIASFDADWENPVWDIDDKPEKVTKALGNSRILLSDITNAIGAALDLKTGRMEEIILAPDDAEYDY